MTSVLVIELMVSVFSVPTGPPGEPAGIRATNPTKHTVIVAWTRGATNGASVSSYIVEKFNQESQEWIWASNGELF